MRNEKALTNDIVFKIFFHDNKDYLTMVVNEVLKLNIKEEDIKFSNTEIVGRNIKDKVSVLDIKIILPSKECVFVEMQNVTKEDYIKRMAYYNGKIMERQLMRSNMYENIRNVYGIFFINDSHETFNNMYTKLTMCDIIRRKEVGYPLENHVINLRKLEDNDLFSQKMRNFLKYMSLEDEESRIEMMGEDETIKKVHEEVDRITSSEAYMDYMFSVEKDELDRINEMHYATKEATEKGMNEGIKKGIEQGIENNIKAMHENNIDLETISKITNKSIDEINNILKK